MLGGISELGSLLEPSLASEPGQGRALEQGWGGVPGSGLGLRWPPGHASHRPPWPRRWPPTPPPQTRPGRRIRLRRSLNSSQTPGRWPSSWTSPPWWTLWAGRGRRVRALGAHSPGTPAASAASPGDPGLPWPLTQLRVSDTHVALQQVVHPAGRLLLELAGLGRAEQGVRGSGPCSRPPHTP